MTDMKRRKAAPQDCARMAEIANETLFPGEYLTDMIAPFFDGTDQSQWHVAERKGHIIGFTFAQPEEMTSGTWNLKAICVDPTVHRRGAGRILLDGLIKDLTNAARLLVIDTTQTPDQAAGRALYAALGCEEIATIPEFWEPGVDKVTFLKRLG